MKALTVIILIFLVTNYKPVSAAAIAWDDETFDSVGFDPLTIKANFFGSVGLDKQDSLQTIAATSVSFQRRYSRLVAMLAGVQTGVYDPGNHATSWFCLYTSLTTFFQAGSTGLMIEPTLTFSCGKISLQESRTLQLSLSSKLEYPLVSLPKGRIKNAFSVILLAGYGYDFFQKSSGYYLDAGFSVGEWALFTFNVASFIEPQNPIHNFARSR